MLLSLCALLTLAACGQNARTYPPGYEANFTRSCVGAGSTAAMCACMWARIEAEIPVRDFEAADAAIRAGQDHPVKAKLVEIATSCSPTPSKP